MASAMVFQVREASGVRTARLQQAGRRGGVPHAALDRVPMRRGYVIDQGRAFVED